MSIIGIIMGVVGASALLHFLWWDNLKSTIHEMEFKFGDDKWDFTDGTVSLLNNEYEMKTYDPKQIVERFLNAHHNLTTKEVKIPMYVLQRGGKFKNFLYVYKIDRRNYLHIKITNIKLQGNAPFL